jgi:hypothetical protein
MENEFVSHQIALRMKVLGYDEPCFGFFNWDGVFRRLHFLDGSMFLNNNSCLAPTYHSAFKWFRNKHGLKSWIQEHTVDTFIYEIRPHVLCDYEEDETYVYDNHEQTELACIEKLCEIVEKYK